MKAVITGVERRALHFAANGIRCDACPTQVNFERYEFSGNAHIRAHFRSTGWVCNDETYSDLCPACARILFDQL